MRPRLSRACNWPAWLLLFAQRPHRPSKLPCAFSAAQGSATNRALKLYSFPTYDGRLIGARVDSGDAPAVVSTQGADAVIGCIRPAIADFVGGANRVYLEGVEKERTARKHKAYYDKSSNRGLIDMPDRYERPHHSEEGKGGYKARSSG
jgi:hypothetical protein